MNQSITTCKISESEKQCAKEISAIGAPIDLNSIRMLLTEKKQNECVQIKKLKETTEIRVFYGSYIEHYTLWSDSEASAGETTRRAARKENRVSDRTVGRIIIVGDVRDWNNGRRDGGSDPKSWTDFILVDDDLIFWQIETQREGGAADSRVL